MDAKLKADWVAALRSGKFKQAHIVLRASGAYCCLGVLCRVAKIPIARDGRSVSKSRDYWPIAEIVGGQTMNRLMGMNDQGSSFPEIADYIEANL